MNGIIGWVKQIFVLSILSGLVIHLMPSKKYEQYVRFICGIVITAACITPFISVIAGESSVWDSYRSILNMQGVEELKQELKFNAAAGDTAMVTQYQEAAASVVEKKVLEGGLYPVQTTVVIDTDPESADYGALQQINLTVSLTKEADAKDKIVIDRIRIDTSAENGQEKAEGPVLDPKVAALKSELARAYEINPANISIQVQN